MTPLAAKTRFRSQSDPGVQARPAGPVPLSPQASRLAGVRLPVLARPSPVAQTPSSPKLDHKGVGGGTASIQGHYEPCLLEEYPSMEHSPLLLERICTDVKGMVLVKQSEGAASATLSLVNRDLKQCAVVLIRNGATGKVWMGHHDSGSASMANSEGERPVSPATPRRGLLGRDRFGYEAFMKEPGAKTVLLVESEQAYDRREVIQKIVARGAVEVRPLTLSLGDYPEDAQWHIAYDPKADRMAIHLEELEQSSVMHFSGLLTDGQPVRRPDDKAGGQALDIANGLHVYKDRCAKAELDSNTRAIVNACLNFVEVRNMDPGLAVDALDELMKLPGVPMDLLGARIHPLNKKSPVVQILTGLVEKCLSHQV
jgi:hypothetical protein